jgi:hypothetical protein
MQIGPSLTDSTRIMARKRPVSTRTPAARSASQNRSYSGSASSGGAAASKAGRRPLRASASSENALIASTAPPACTTSRFIFPEASGKMRKCRTLSASSARSASPSPASTPT